MILNAGVGTNRGRLTWKRGCQNTWKCSHTPTHFIFSLFARDKCQGRWRNSRRYRRCLKKITQIYAFFGRDPSGRDQPSSLRSVSVLPAAVCSVTITARGRGQRRAFPNLFRLFNPCERENNRKFLCEVPTGRGEEFTPHRQPPFNCSYCQLECIYSSVHIIIWETAVKVSSSASFFIP